MSKQQYTPATGPAIAQFEADLLESVAQMERGEYAAIHTPAAIQARRNSTIENQQETHKAAQSKPE